MPPVTGLNHVAVMTGDLDRFIAFYTAAFGFEVVFHESEQGMRHAVLRIGAESWLHPVEVQGGQHASGDSPMFQRGHLDHLALTAASRDAFEQTRQRLVAAGASDGAVDDLGAYHAPPEDDRRRNCPESKRSRRLALHVQLFAQSEHITLQD
jgi:catechol 2,3-dioxygenase-like lactoylglutathione lyase family enzyme